MSIYFGIEATFLSSLNTGGYLIW